ncbi:serine/threonine-protein kinase 11-interacting protein isoform X2 [Chelonus insularis]|uniref:serine/threonine-protein kinase 11-interacting protein isoform X2 n=1 Tax=Chelonus insularis TaxID=460826 RepID=UPI001588F684|nr:serine/threonine-protein kinase 11-interacting protein isoform X2 [Chelonus insularis]
MALNRSSGMSNMPELIDLAQILRKNGDQVLSGTSKLLLSTKLLHNLNDAFSLIVDDSRDFESSFQVCNSSEIDLFRDLKFLHDFVQKTIHLKIIQTTTEGGIDIDITKFRHLKYLELQKVCIDSVKGIQGIRGQLESISCTGGGGVGTIGRLLATCGGDAGVGFVWASLKRLALPYNSLGRLDKSLELAPWLETLDLSHNRINVATEVDCLPNLKHVNLGFNKLETVPMFNKATYRNLRTLVLKNNYIDNLSGLQNLELAELDLSYNCLIDHSSLWPLETITSLLWLNLEGNPIFYHKKHRNLTLKHLYPSLAESKFVLDHQPLTKSEKIIVSGNRLFTVRNIISSSKVSTINESAEPGVRESTSTQPVNDLSTSQVPTSAEKSFTKSKRKPNVREVDIADDDTMKEPKLNDFQTTLNLLETSMEHLETKKKILALREKYGGDKWLSSDSGSYIQDIMGLERSRECILSSTPAITTCMIDANEQNKSISPENVCLNDNTVTEDSSHDEIKIIQESKTNLEEILEQTKAEIAQIEALENIYDPEKDTGELFLVRKKNENSDGESEVLLIINKENIKEVEAITRKIKYKWSIDTVISCIMGRGTIPTIDFIFDTTRRDRQNRSYFAESEDAVKIVRIIGDLIKVRPILLTIFKCMKCSTHFSQDPQSSLNVIKSKTIKSPTCPSCNSTLVIQTDELMTPDLENEDHREVIDKKDEPMKEKLDNLKDSKENSPSEGDLEHSTSHSSIGSATSLDDSRESTPSTGAVMKKYESDIEILSNPSQSSIEVLDDGSKSHSTPNRKRSSEERRIAIAPTLLTIPDTTPVMAGLTESSSSGSLTDSICTAYENKKLEALKIPERRSQVKVDHEPEHIENVENTKESYASVSNLTSMLGDLLSSMKISTRGSPSKSADEPEYLTSDIQYSYTNFSSIDHRIKLHLILNVFELENEELVLLLRAEILLQNQITTFPGCLVLSTSKIYILTITGIEGEDPSRWLHKKMSWTMDRLRTFAPLPFKQGVLVELEQPNRVNEDLSHFTVLCILQDFQRTSNFLFYLTDLPLPTSCEVEFAIPEQCTTAIHNLMMASKYYRTNDAVRIFALFSSAKLNLENQPVKLKIGGLLITTSTLILTEDKLNWLIPDSNNDPAKLTEQAMSNLIEVVSDEKVLELNFLDEVVGIEEIWTLTFESTEAASAVISAIKPPWEELFSVPLQITTKAQSEKSNNKIS